MSTTGYVVGLSLGQPTEATALAVTERVTEWRYFDEHGRELPGAVLAHWRAHPLGDSYLAKLRQTSTVSYRVSHLERLPVGTAYPAVVRHVAELLTRSPLREAGRGRSHLAVDVTALGRTAVELFRRAEREGLLGRVQPVAVSLTAGDALTVGGGVLHVPRRDLIGTLLVTLQSDRLRISGQLAHAAALRRELLDYRTKPSPAAALEGYGRVSASEDLLRATALTVWHGEQAHWWPSTT